MSSPYNLRKRSITTLYREYDEEDLDEEETYPDGDVDSDQSYVEDETGPSAPDVRRKKVPRSTSQDRKNTTTTSDSKKATKSSAHDLVSSVPRHSLDEMPSLVLEQIMLYLGSAREVASLSQSSPLLRNVITYDIVVQAALYSNNGECERIDLTKLMENKGSLWTEKYIYKPSTAMEWIVKYLKQKSIFVPSPLQLLANLTSNRCVNGRGCLNYNLNTGIPGREWKGIRPFGLSLCWECVQWTSMRTYFNVPGIAIWDDNRVLLDPYHTQDGTPQGPIISGRELTQWLNTCRNCGEENVEDTIAEKFDNDRAKEIIRCFDAAEVKAKVFLEEKRALVIKKENQRKEARLTDRLTKRENRGRALLQLLEEILQSTEPNYKRLILRGCDWRSGYCYFRISVVDECLGKLFRKSSKVSRKKLREAAEQTVHAIQNLDENGLLSGPRFLNAGDFANVSTHIGATYEDLAQVTRLLVMIRRFAFFHWQNNKLLLHNTNRIPISPERRSSFTLLMSFLREEDLENIFIQIATLRFGSFGILPPEFSDLEDKSFIEHKFRENLARTIWRIKWTTISQGGDPGWSDFGFTAWARQVNACESCYKTTLYAARDFFALPETVLFIQQRRSFMPWVILGISESRTATQYLIRQSHGNLLRYLRDEGFFENFILDHVEIMSDEEDWDY